MTSPEATSQTILAARRLRELILNGDLAAGERVSEIPLSERVGVSRTPLRLALSRLEHEGLLEPLPTGGFAVRRLTYADAVDAIELRGVLEGTAARMAAERLEHPRQLEALQRCSAELDELAVTPQLSSDDVTRYIELNDRFHAALVELPGSEVLRHAVERIFHLPFASPSAFVEVDAELLDPREWLVVAQDQHRRILDAIANREGTRAEAIAREHARETKRSLDIAIRERGDLEQLPHGAAMLLHKGSSRTGSGR